MQMQTSDSHFERINSLLQTFKNTNTLNTAMNEMALMSNFSTTKITTQMHCGGGN